MNKMKACNARPRFLSALLAVVLALPGCTVQAESGTESTTSEVWSYEGMTVLEDPELFMSLNDEQPSAEPSEAPTMQPSTKPTTSPSADPTTVPTDMPTTQPSVEPTTEPTTEPSASPSEEPTSSPTTQPTTEPTTVQTEAPSSSPSPEATATPEPVQHRYTISIAAPTGWRNTSAAAARVEIIDENGTGWARVRISTGSTGWEDVTDRFSSSGSIDYNVHDNGTMIVRVTDANGEHHEAQAKVSCFDRKAPSVSVNVKENPLHVEATDDLSGVAGIQINGLLFTSVQGGKLDVYFDETLRSYEKLSVRAYDYAGNFSEAITLNNPYYGYPTQPTAAPTAKPTTKPTSKPTKTASPTSTPVTQATATPYVKPVITPLPTIIPTAAPTATAVPTATPMVIMATPAPQYIQTGPGEAFTGSGNMQTLDMLYSASTNKQFITVQTRKGETYYLIIDYDKPIDEAADIYETYFLNLVDDRDLLSVLSEDEIPTPTPTPVVIIATPEPTAVPVPQPDTKDDDGKAAALFMLMLVALVGCGAALWYFKLHNDSDKKNTAMLDDELDEDEEDEEL